MPVHWQRTYNGSWSWLQREIFLDGQWRLSGITIPVHRKTGKPLEDATGYLDPSAAPAEFFEPDPLAAEYEIAMPDEGVSTSTDQPGPDALPERRARHGRPPSRWLRTLNAAELSLWLTTIDPPEAGVSGMTFLEHLTRDHGFDAERVAGLLAADQEKLHAAAHHGY
ncbi:hypothetical protein [Botrimarina hoheduenensis]|nr:hypothetical protein [Botrimarina hoheduenensis]